MWLLRIRQKIDLAESQAIQWKRFMAQSLPFPVYLMTSSMWYGTERFWVLQVANSTLADTEGL